MTLKRVRHYIRVYEDFFTAFLAFDREEKEHTPWTVDRHSFFVLPSIGPTIGTMSGFWPSSFSFQRKPLESRNHGFWRKTDRVSSGHFDNDRQAPKDGPKLIGNPRGKRVYRPLPRMHTTCLPDTATWTVLLRRRHKRRYPVSLDTRAVPC